ncbi:hypothetical protein [Anianabacter salinae]|uniref:hypothetical protein n=1 Tax=Anianabacter salinae TaxID=2851023 RepID=UPI00225E5F92|nr:hypothetical protein [Anianabacter salinae]MBV0911972.1 hypothetical protein [Anianabacter salinae]
MLKTSILALGLSLAALPVAAQPMLAVNDIEVTADFSAVDDTNVLQRWPNLEADLQQVVAQTLIDRAADDGYDIRITLNEVSLDGAVTLGDDGAFNTMSGDAAIYDGNEEILGNAVIALRAELGSLTVPPGTLIALPSDTAFYNAMLLGFAEQVDAEIDQVSLRTPTADAKSGGVSN